MLMFVSVEALVHGLVSKVVRDEELEMEVSDSVI